MRYLVTEIMRFPGLRAVHEMTIEPVLAGRDAVGLAPTAGGTTEAAMLPVLSRILIERWEPVPVLFVCPLKALLNNQEPRIERMARSLGLGVTVWREGSHLPWLYVTDPGAVGPRTTTAIFQHATNSGK